MLMRRRLILAAGCAALGALVVPEVGAVGGRPLRMGIFPRRNASLTMSLFQPLADFLQSQLGRNVVLETNKDFPAFWDAVRQRRYDIVHFNQYHYLQARLHYGYRVVARNVEFGSDVIAGALYVRAESRLQRTEELRGHKVVFGGDRSAMMSYIVPTWLLRQAGLKAGDYVEEFAVSPPNAVFAAYYRQTDAAGAGDMVARLPMVTEAIDMQKMRILAISPPMPQLPWAVRDDLPLELRQLITELLVGLTNHPQGREVLADAKLSALRAVDDEAYDRLEAIVREVLGEQALMDGQ